METTTEDPQKENTDTTLASSTSNSAPSPQVEQKKSKKEDRTKKDDKNLEQFMKSLNSIPTLEEKLSLVCKKYVQTSDENKKMNFYIKQSDKRYTLLMKEKEQLQLEFNKTVLVKSKLENLCRELQKQNKAIKEESLLKIREEEERRKETQAKFQNTLTEITTMLQQNNEKNAKLRDDNISMTEKFKSVVTQYQLREQQVDKMTKQMALENQLSEAKMQKANLEHQADKERLLSEMEQLKVTVATYRAKIMELQGIETNLRSQLAVYTDKYDEFQNALVKSNQMFGGFKEQMDKMSKKIKKLEKESLSWKSRWETSQTALLDMCGERQASEERAAASVRQLHHMQSLCRTLQAERGSLLATLKEHNIERPPLPAPSPAPAPAPPVTAPSGPASNAKVDAMAANCAQLRQSLAHLQTQLNVLTNKQKEDSPKPETKTEKQEKKKSKSKKKKTESSPPKEESELVDKNQTNVSENTTQKPDTVDETTLENLIQAINNANINLCDLEVVSDEIAETVTDDGNVEVQKDIEKVEAKVAEVSCEDQKEVKKGATIAQDTCEVQKENKDNKTVEPRVEEVAVESQKEIKKGETRVEDVTCEVQKENQLLGSVVEELNINNTKVDANIVENGGDIHTNGIENTDKAKIDVDKTNLTDTVQNTSIVESVNAEISHFNEVKPILNNV